MCLFPKQISIEEAVEIVKNERSSKSVRISKLCENHVDMKINVVNIEIYPRGSSHPFDRIGNYKIICNGKSQADRYMKKLMEL